MDKETKNQKAKEPDFVLQWGNRKRHRCVKAKNKDPARTLASATNGSNHHNSLSPGKFSSDSMTRKRLNSGVLNTKKDSFSQSSHRGLSSRSSDPTVSKRRISQHSPEKEDRFYTTRGSVGADENSKLLLDHTAKNDKSSSVWPKLFLSLSSKEKEEDFMAFKGCKPPQRPKKRAKLIQRSVLLVCPGTWLSDLSQERYEVREKKASKKKPRGLKAMGSMESDSE